jgi:hypothetical protein
MLITLLGFITGVLVGLTGTGGGVLLTPLLMIFTGYPALVIIGTDIVNGAITKLLGTVEHQKLSQVRWRLAGFLVLGTLPGTVGGIALINLLKAHMPAGRLDHFLRVGLGATLIMVALLLPFVRLRKTHRPAEWVESPGGGKRLKLMLVGALVGFLVAMTSVGSGSLLMVFLLLFTPFPIGQLVGTDIVYGLATMALAGSMHVWMGHFDAGLLLRLVVGALPGVVLGARLSRIVPERQFNWLFSVLYLSLGARLLIGASMVPK